MVVTMLAAYLPARRAGKMPPVAAMRDDIALPESTLHRRIWIGAVLFVIGLGTTWLGAFTQVDHSAYWVGAGVLALVMAAILTSPVVGRPVIRALRCRLSPDVRRGGPHGRAERDPQPPPHGRHGVGADDRPDAGVDDVGVRRLREGQRRQVDQRDLRRRLRRLQRDRAAILHIGDPGGRRRAGSGRRQPDPLPERLGRRRPCLRSCGRPGGLRQGGPRRVHGGLAGRAEAGDPAAGRGPCRQAGCHRREQGRRPTSPARRASTPWPASTWARPRCPTRSS